MDASTGDAIKTWRFSNMKQWNVNWEIKMVSCNHASLTHTHSRSAKNELIKKKMPYKCLRFFVPFPLKV